MALLPLLAQNSGDKEFSWIAVAIPIAVIVGFVVFGRLLASVRAIASIEDRDLFTAATLLIVIASAVAMQKVGLSMGLGAFLAGVLLADSEYRHELEADIAPFKGLLLGLFFMAIGMSAKISLWWSQPVLVFSLVLAVFVIKGAVLFSIRKLMGGTNIRARKVAVFLSQGGEFAFVLFGAALAAKVIDVENAELFTVVITTTLFLAPLVFFGEDLLCKDTEEVSASDYDSKMDQSPVVIAGFGRFGQITARLLTLRKIPFTALDKNSAHVDFVRKFGNRIFYGDATRLDLLMAAKVKLPNCSFWPLMISKNRSKPQRWFAAISRMFPFMPGREIVFTLTN